MIAPPIRLSDLVQWGYNADPHKTDPHKTEMIRPLARRTVEVPRRFINDFRASGAAAS